MAASWALQAWSSEPPPATIPGSLPIELARPLEGCVAPTAAAVARHTALMTAEAGGALLPLPGIIPSEAASDAASLRSAASPSCKGDGGRGRPAWVDPVRKSGQHQHQRGGSLPIGIFAGGSGDDAVRSPARSSASMAAVRESLTSAKGVGLGRCPQTMGAEDDDLSPLRDVRDAGSSNRVQGGTAAASVPGGGGLLLEANCCSSGAVSAICTARGWALAAAGRDGVRILSVAHRVRLVSGQPGGMGSGS